MSCCCNTGKQGNGRNGRNGHTDTNSDKGVNKSKVMLTVLLGALSIGAILYFIGSGSMTGDGSIGIRTAEAAVTPLVVGNEVTFPESAFVDGKAKFFTYKTADGKTVRYFVIRSSDGVIRAAFDACDVCYEAGKGYYQQDDVMVCRNCGRRFPSARVNVVTGGCNPSALTRTIKDGKVVIPVPALNEGKKFF